MSNIWAIYKRELTSYFYSPLAYVIYVLFLIITGVFFWMNVTYFSEISMMYMSQQQNQFGMQTPQLPNYTELVLQGLSGVMAFILLFIIPLLSMRLLSEEKKMGTIELLMTYPIRDIEVVLGKYFAVLTVFAGMLLLSFNYTLISSMLINQTYIPVVLATYVGVFLIGASFLSFGMFASSLTENQIVAGLVSFSGLIVLWMIGFIKDLQPNEMLGSIAEHISVITHFEPFSQGVIETSGIAFYLLFTAFFLFVTLRVMESHRWRG